MKTINQENEELDLIKDGFKKVKIVRLSTEQIFQAISEYMDKHHEKLMCKESVLTITGTHFYIKSYGKKCPLPVDELGLICEIEVYHKEDL